MAQPSVASYFNTRKRTAIEDLKINRARKVLLVEECDVVANGVAEEFTAECKENEDGAEQQQQPNDKSAPPKNADAKAPPKRPTKSTKPAKFNQANIQELFNNMSSKKEEMTAADPVELLKTPPSTPKKTNLMDKLNVTGKELSLKEIKNKLTRSSRLADLKASMARFKEAANKLEQVEKKTAQIPDSPSLKAFKSIQLEVTLSPTKVQSPEKLYLSPKKDTTARRNLLNLLSPTKNALQIPSSPSKQLFAPQKTGLTLPYKYRTVAELFRSVDTVCQIMHNRKETITFRKLKPAVEELLKRNLFEKHLAQMKSIYPDAFKFTQEKLRVFGTGTKHEQWELVVAPVLTQEVMSSDILLNRRRQLFNTLIDKVKNCHREFLLGLTPPMNIPLDKITRWHPEFDIERVPDIELADLPQPPNEEKFSTGKDVLEKAKTMFNCNSRMEQALERLKQAQESNPELMPETPKDVPSLLKGIPKALLEKVRQRQAAKALESMTRSDAKDKELELYSSLPELARLTRNLFVAERKSVLAIEFVLDKLNHSMRTFKTKQDIESRLKTLSKELPGWIAFHTIRNGDFIKISKNTDISLVMNKLDKLIKLKSA